MYNNKLVKSGGYPYFIFDIRKTKGYSEFLVWDIQDDRISIVSFSEASIDFINGKDSTPYKNHPVWGSSKSISLVTRNLILEITSVRSNRS